MVCDVALADLFSDVAPVCLIIASVVLLITVYRLTATSLVDGEGQAQFSQRISKECFRFALLPFSDEFRSVRLNGFAFTWRRHVTLDCFNCSTHFLFLLYLNDFICLSGAPNRGVSLARGRIRVPGQRCRRRSRRARTIPAS